jgi:hypothetical protein
MHRQATMINKRERVKTCGASHPGTGVALALRALVGFSAMLPSQTDGQGGQDGLALFLKRCGSYSPSDLLAAQEGPQPISATAETNVVVEFARSGKTYALRSGQTLLEAAEGHTFSQPTGTMWDLQNEAAGRKCANGRGRRARSRFQGGRFCAEVRGARGRSREAGCVKIR